MNRVWPIVRNFCSKNSPVLVAAGQTRRKHKGDAHGRPCKTIKVDISPNPVRNGHLSRFNSILIKTIVDFTNARRFNQTRPVPKHLQLNDHKEVFEYLGPLGKGACGVVQAVRFKGNKELFALKMVELNNMSPKGVERREHLVNEIDVYPSLKDHRHIAKKISSFTDKEHIGLLISPVADQTLLQVLEKLEIEDYGLLRLQFGCLASAVWHLHKNRIIHNDFKLTNIVLKGQKVYIIDFGISRAIELADETGIVGPTPSTRLFASPEACFGKYNGRMRDIFSLGVVYTYMFAALKGKDVTDVLDFLAQNGNGDLCPGRNVEGLQQLLTYLKNTGFAEDNCVVDWISPMIQENQNLRLTASQLMEKILNSQSMSGNSYCGNCCRGPVRSNH